MVHALAVEIGRRTVLCDALRYTLHNMQLLLHLLLLADRLGWLPVEDLLLLKNLEELHVAWNGFGVSSM